MNSKTKNDGVKQSFSPILGGQAVLKHKCEMFH